MGRAELRRVLRAADLRQHRVHGHEEQSFGERDIWGCEGGCLLYGFLLDCSLARRRSSLCIENARGDGGVWRVALRRGEARAVGVTLQGGAGVGSVRGVDAGAVGRGGWRKWRRTTPCCRGRRTRVGWLRRRRRGGGALYARDLGRWRRLVPAIGVPIRVVPFLYLRGAGPGCGGGSGGGGRKRVWSAAVCSATPWMGSVLTARLRTVPRAS
jgi:hypothetical protein